MLNNALFFNRKYCPEVIKRERVLRVSKKRRSARGVSILHHNWEAVDESILSDIK